MPYYERELYKKFPLYARFLDEKGMLQHFAEALQPEFTAFYQTMAERNYLFDPDLVPERFINFVAQSVGLANRGDHTLGIGINPTWDIDRKRELFKEAWVYWQTKGTQDAIRRGTYFWLGWQDALDSARFSTLQPFGLHPTSSPPLWWDYETPYDDHLDLKWGERKQLGSGDYPQSYEPNWDSFTAANYSWEWSDPWWQDREHLAVDRVTPIDSPGSMLGPRSVWLQYSPDPGDWGRVFPDVLELNPEMLSTVARPAVFGWIEGGTVEPLWVEDFLLPDNTTEIIQDLEIDGLKWGELFPSTTGDYRPEPFIVEEDEIEFGVWTGHRWNDPWEYDWYYVGLKLVRIRSVKAAIEGAISPIRLGLLNWSAEFSAIAPPPAITSSTLSFVSTDFSLLDGCPLSLQLDSFGFSADFLDEKSSTLAPNSLRVKATTELRSTAFTELESNERSVKSPEFIGFSADLGLLIDPVEVNSGVDSFDWIAERTLQFDSVPILISSSEPGWTASFVTTLEASSLSLTPGILSTTVLVALESAPLLISVDPLGAIANATVSTSETQVEIDSPPVEVRAYNWFIQNVVA